MVASRAARIFAFASAFTLSAGVGAAPRPAEPLPDVVGVDVNGQQQRLRSLVRGPTLVVAITDRGAEGRMRAWFEAAERRIAPEAQRVSVVSIGVPFFVSDGLARSKAREHVPPRWREQTLMDVDHRMAQALGLAQDGLPWAFAVDEDGNVLAAVHAYAEDPASEVVWDALLRAGVSGPAASGGPPGP
ncbi:MAG TPA: hypothetical protein VGK67_28405 [Myxococcales bacterium]|jgi:hypothetical protein